MNRHLVTWVMAMAIVSAGSEAALAKTLREQSEKVIDARGLRGLRIDNARGLVSVRAGSDREVRITALKLVRGDADAVTRHSRATRVVSETQDGVLRIRVVYPQRQNLEVSFWDLLSGYEFPRVEVRLSLEVPADLPLRVVATSADVETDLLEARQVIQTTSGDVVVRAMRGALDVSSTSGDVTASGAGSVHARTVSGDIRIDEPQGALELESTSGRIEVEGTADTLRTESVSGDVRAGEVERLLSVRTTSGDIAIGRAAGRVTAESASGGIQVGLGSALRDAELVTASGGIEVDLDPALGCALDLRTSSGTVDVSVPMKVETVTRRAVLGKVRNGAAPVRIHSSSGDIAVRGGN